MDSKLKAKAFKAGKDGVRLFSCLQTLWWTTNKSAIYLHLSFGYITVFSFLKGRQLSPKAKTAGANTENWFSKPQQKVQRKGCLTHEAATDAALNVIYVAVCFLPFVATKYTIYGMRQTIHCTDKKINSEHTSVGLTHACPKTNDSAGSKD